MFCSKCGKQIPDNTKFCNHCGAQQPVLGSTEPQPVPQPQPAPQSQPAPQPQWTPQPQPQPAPQPQTPQKKKPNYLVIVAVFICAALIGKFVIAPSMTSDSDKDSGKQGSQGSQHQSSSDTGSAAYNQIFTEANIVHFSSAFGSETASFAIKQADGSIICNDYGYIKKNSYAEDVVTEWVQTLYLPVSGLTDTQKTEKENLYRNQCAHLEAISCCSVSYTMGTNYLSIVITFTNLDKAENYTAMYNAKINTANGPISMSATEKNHISQGYVKK